jgi:putative FmdB family regulatory protein
MPLYDYVCVNCGERIEVLHGVHDSGPDRCQHCGQGPMRKLLTAPAIHFKGTGWAKKERAVSRSKGSGSESQGSGDTRDKAAEKKPDGATEAPAAKGGGSTAAEKPAPAASGRATGGGSTGSSSES